MAFNFEKKNSSSKQEPSSKALGFLNGNLGTKAGGSRKIMVGIFTGDKQQDLEFHQWMMSGTEEQRAKKLEYVKANLTLTYNPAEPSEGSFFELPDVV